MRNGPAEHCTLRRMSRRCSIHNKVTRRPVFRPLHYPWWHKCWQHSCARPGVMHRPETWLLAEHMEE